MRLFAKIKMLGNPSKKLPTEIRRLSGRTSRQTGAERELEPGFPEFRTIFRLVKIRNGDEIAKRSGCNGECNKQSDGEESPEPSS